MPHGIHRVPNLLKRRATLLFTVPLIQTGIPPGCTGFGIWWIAVESKLGRVVSRALLRPQQLADLQCVVKQASALLERQADGFVLLALPADTDTQVDTATGQHIHRRQLLGQNGRTSQRCEKYCVAYPDAGSGGGHRGQKDKGLKPIAIRPCRLPATCHTADRRVPVGIEVLAEHQVVRDDDAVDADGIHRARHVERCIPVLVGIVGIRS